MYHLNNKRFGIILPTYMQAFYSFHGINYDIGVNEFKLSFIYLILLEINYENVKHPFWEKR